MLISNYVCLFTIYSIFGWIFETLYCTIKTGKWENRGFLYGPVCPIYGTGAVAIILVVNSAESKGIPMEPWPVFAISVVGSMALEFCTSLALEKTFHAVWWEYNDIPFNIQGRTSILTGLCFGFAGLLIIYKMTDFNRTILEQLNPLLAECLALVFVFVYAADLTLTVTVLHHFDRLVIRMEDRFNQNMDMLVDSAANRTSRIRQGLVDTKYHIEEQINSLGGFTKSAIRRARYFRDNNKKIESIKNQVLSVVTRAIGRAESSEENGEISTLKQD